MVMAREYQHIKMLQRSGNVRFEDNGAIVKEQKHQLAVDCPACPHPGKNLPDNWRVQKHRYAMD